MSAPEPLRGELVPAAVAPQLPAVARPGVDATHLYAALLADARSPRTRQARVEDILDLGRFLALADPPDPEATCAALVAGGVGTANALALGYRAALQARSLSPATINRRLSTLRRVVTLARRFGLVAWTLEVEGFKVKKFRDTAGPGPAGRARLFARTRTAATTPQGHRDLALISVLYSGGLRRAEAIGLDLVDLDLPNCKVRILPKGKQETEWVPISTPAAEALAAWLAVRPATTDPAVFVRLDRRAGPNPSRLRGEAARRLVARLGRRAELSRPLAPHQLRHAAITSLYKKGVNMVDMQTFGRHENASTTGRYVDNARDMAATLAEMLGQDLVAE